MAVTSANVLRGTPLYVAPEAIKGDPLVDARSDLYALGAVGYFLLTGTPVFEASNVVEVFAHHPHTPPAPPSGRTAQSIPSELEAVILQCLAKEPARRPPDARSLRRALAACPCSIPWSVEDASRWWSSYRAAHPGATLSRTRPATAQETVVVDLADRVADR